MSKSPRCRGRPCAAPRTLLRQRRRSMFEEWSSPTRRSVLISSAAAAAFNLLPAHIAPAAESGAIRPFRVNIPEEQLVDLRRRIEATRWPDRETVMDRSQGVRLATLQELVGHWGTDYDWRKAEAKLNASPQFMTEIDGLDIHFVHV